MVGDLMAITYPVKSGKITHKYNIDGIDKRPRIDQEDRWDLLLQIIARNVHIPHTHIIKIAQHLSGIAKKTIEKELNRLEEQKLLKSTKEGTSPNSPRLWEIPPPEIPEEKQAKQFLTELMGGMDETMKKMEEQYPKMDLVYRPIFLYYLLEAVHKTEYLFIATEWFMDVSKQRKQFDVLKKKADTLIQKDPEFGKVFSMFSQRFIPDLQQSIHLVRKYLK